MDEIKNVLQQLPPQDIAILQTIYNPELARQKLTDNGQRMVAILDGLSVEEQQDAVDVVPQEMPLPPEWWDVNVEISDTTVEWAPADQELPTPAEEEQMPNPAGNLKDFLI